jgi:signal peptidase I
MRTGRSWLWSYVLSLGAAAIALAGAVGLFLGLRTSCFQAFRMPTGSMEPTILIGDHLIANKMAYGLRAPGTSWVFAPHGPKRGDVIVFLYPLDRTRMFVKRVIGLPGEQIEMLDRTVRVDGRPLEEPYAHYLDLPDRLRPAYGPERVPEGHLFVLGDNRDNSSDSRTWGSIPVEDVRAQAWRIYLSIDSKGALRTERIGRRIE